MGRDAFVHIDKSKYSKETVSDLLIMMGYKKRGDAYYLGNDDEYKYLSGINVWLMTKEQEFLCHVRTQIFASGYDIHEQNNTIRKLRKYCSAWLESDMGKNRYFEEDILIKGAESGCYFAIQNLDNNFSMLHYAVSKFPQDCEGETMMKKYNVPTPSSFNVNVYLSFLCSLIEEYFRATYIALLKYSDKKEKVLKHLSSYDLAEISEGNSSIEESFAYTLSFQNIGKITTNFNNLDGKLDISTPLKKPYHRRKNNLYDKINDILERRHRMIHHMDFDIEYTTEQFQKDVKDIKVAFIRVYKYICNCYGWEPQDVVLSNA